MQYHRGQDENTKAAARSATNHHVELTKGWTIQLERAGPAKRRLNSWLRLGVLFVLAATGGWIYKTRTAHSLGLETGIDLPQVHLATAFAAPPDSQFVFGNNVGGMAVSPDGKWIAYVVATNGYGNRLWVRELDYAYENETDHPIPKTEGAAYPFWSPDSQSIAFFSKGELKRVRLAGGEPTRICEVVFGRGGAWVDQDDIIFGSLLSGLSRVSASGSGVPTPLTQLDTSSGETGHSWPQMLPGKRFIYWVRSDNPDHQGIYGASLANPTAWKLIKPGIEANAVYARGAHGKEYLLWLVKGELWAQEFDAGTLTTKGDAERMSIRHPVTRIGLLGHANMAIPAQGLFLYAPFNAASQFAKLASNGDPADKMGQPDQYTTFRISPTGGRIAVSRDKPGGTDLLIDVQTRSTTIVTDPGINAYPLWSPDGRRILYTASNLNLFLKRLDQGTTMALTHSPNPKYGSDWSKDGKVILYWEVSPTKKKRQLWKLPMEDWDSVAAKSSAQPYLETNYNDSWARFSPEAMPKRVVYQSDASGEDEIYIDSFPNADGHPTKISDKGGRYPVWNPNGNEIFYVSPDFSLMSVTLKRDTMPLQHSAPRRLYSIPAVDIGWPPYDVDPETGRIWVRAITPEQPPQPLTLIVNWSLLTKD